MNQTVFIVDDDDAIRAALQQLLEISGFDVKSYADGASFVAECDEDCAGCVLLDMAMPELSGHDVQAQLIERGIHIPIIFLTGHGEVPDAVHALQAGAVDFLQKPVDSDTLLARIRQSLALDAKQREKSSQINQIRQRYATLSPREKEVMGLVVGGGGTKDIARKLGLSPRTVEVHRTHVMYKMGAKNLAHLVKMSGDSQA